jgi:hypothetical protein
MDRSLNACDGALPKILTVCKKIVRVPNVVQYLKIEFAQNIIAGKMLAIFYSNNI